MQYYFLTRVCSCVVFGYCEYVLEPEFSIDKINDPLFLGD